MTTSTTTTTTTTTNETSVEVRPAKKVRADAVGAFSVSPRDSGQMVEIAYAWVDGGDIICRRTDRSDRSVAYTYLEIDQDRAERIDIGNGRTPRGADIVSETPCTIA